MTEPVASEDLESAGPRWKGGVEWTEFWNNYVRHWWRFHPQEPILIHRASGEQVAYVGELREPNWHRFEYRHRDLLYPLAVEMKRVWWPNPRAGQRAGPRLEDREPAELRLFVWRVDHLRSAELWRSIGGPEPGTDQPPPYWLWRRVDQAISDAALLWPKKHPSNLMPAIEVAINGGWVNGSWRENFFRRLRHYDDYDQERDHYYIGSSSIKSIYYIDPTLARSIDRLGLPLPDACLEEVDAPPPRWECVRESGFDLYGQNTYRQTLMKNSSQGAAIAISTGSIHNLERLPWPVLVVLRDGIAWSSQALGHGTRPQSPEIPLAIGSDWTVLLDRYCSIARKSGDSNPVTVPWLDKPVLPYDGITRREVPSYDPAGVNHPLSSYRSWRFLYDCFLNALPFCPGFADEDFGSDMVQGDFGQVKIVGGFVGGIQRLTTEVRLKLELPADTENTTWAKFFS